VVRHVVDRCTGFEGHVVDGNVESQKIFQTDVGTNHGAAQGTGKAVASTGTGVGTVDSGHQFSVEMKTQLTAAVVVNARNENR